MQSQFQLHDHCRYLILPKKRPKLKLYVETAAISVMALIVLVDTSGPIYFILGLLVEDQLKSCTLKCHNESAIRLSLPAPRKLVQHYSSQQDYCISFLLLYCF